MDNTEGGNLAAPVRDLTGKRLLSGQYLGTNEYIVSENHSFFAIMQGDGNFVVYQGTGPGDNRGYVWASSVVGGAASYIALMQNDGNFGIYRGTSLKDFHGLLWNAERTCEGAFFQLRLFNDGNLVLAPSWKADVPDPIYWSTDATTAAVPPYVLDQSAESEFRWGTRGPFWQSFVPDREGALAAVDLIITAPPGKPEDRTMVLSIHQGQGNQGALLAEQEITIPPSPVYYDERSKFKLYSLAVPPFLRRGAVYSLNVRSAKEPELSPSVLTGPGRVYPRGKSSYRPIGPDDDVVLFRTYMREWQPRWDHPVG